MRHFLLCLSLLFAGSVLQAEPTKEHHKVLGTVYAWGEGEIHKLAAKLYLPPKGEGELYIHLHDHKHGKKTTAKAIKFFVEKKHGRSIFYIVFPYTTEDKVVVMKGTYTRDSKIALYSGDIFVGSKEQGLNLSPENILDDHDFEFIGSFFFKKKVLIGME